MCSEELERDALNHINLDPDWIISSTLTGFRDTTLNAILIYMNLDPDWIIS